MPGGSNINGVGHYFQKFHALKALLRGRDDRESKDDGLNFSRIVTIKDRLICVQEKIIWNLEGNSSDA